MTAEARGLAVVQPQQVQAGPLVPYDTDKLRRLFKQVIAQGGSDDQVEAVILLCQRYSLDPLLAHIVLVKNRPYVTRDGLLHVAHMHPAFDGIAVTFERDGQFWVATCTVWRRDKSHPFVYSAHQQEHQQNGGDAWRKYPRAMTQKCAEAMCLKRAFDVALGTAEELGFDGADPSSSLGRVTIIEAEVVDGTDQGRPGRVSAQLPAAGPAARVAQAGEPAEATPAQEPGAEDFTWTEFWPWAKARGLNSRKELDAALGRETVGMTPHQIYIALRARDSAAKERRLWTVDDALVWLQAGERPLDKQEQCCAWIFGQADDEATLAALAERVTPHVHQDARDAAWRERMLALGLMEEGDPAAAEPAQEPDGGAVQGNVPGDEHPDDVPF